MKRIILLFILITFSILAFSDEVDPLENFRNKSEEELRSLKKNHQQSGENLKNIQEDFLKISKTKENVEDLIFNNVNYKNQVNSEIDKELNKLSIFKGEEKKFFKCLKQTLKETASLDPSYSCRNNYKGKLDKSVLEKIEIWSNLTQNMNRLKDNLSWVDKKLEAAQKIMDFNQKEYEKEEKDILRKEDAYKFGIENFKVLSSNKKITNCDKNTPDIDLENESPYPNAGFKGPFFGVPRDNQDGVGTCFANTAKNLLVGISGGQDNASFLDAALVYKSEDISWGLNGGKSCDVLEKVQESSYCPQEFSPSETGKKNTFTESLLGENANMFVQSKMIQLVTSYFDNIDSLDKKNKFVSEKFLTKAALIIDTIKTKNQLPLLINQVPEVVPGFQIYNIVNYGSDEDPLFDSTSFTKEYKEAYDKFYPKYLKAILEGKDRQQLIDLYSENMKTVIEKKNNRFFRDALPALFKKFQGGKISTEVRDDERENLISLNDPRLKEVIRNSLAFINTLNNDKSEGFQSIECNNNLIDTFDSLKSLEDIVKFVQTNNGNPTSLYDKNGKFRSAKDLIQLLVAPACLDEKNRKKLDYKIYCDDKILAIKDGSNKPIDKQKEEFREAVAASLIQGLPLGNGMLQEGIGHVNTIVGMRFNNKNNKCEYKIRESQTGTSDWQDEATIFDNVISLLEVRKK